MQRIRAAELPITDLEWNRRLPVVYNARLESRSIGLIQGARLDEMPDGFKTYPPGRAALIGGDLNSKSFPSIFLRKPEREGFQIALSQRINRTHRIGTALDWIFMRGLSPG